MTSDQPHHGLHRPHHTNRHHHHHHDEQPPIHIDLAEEVITTATDDNGECTNSNDSTERIFDYSGSEASAPCFIAVHLGAGYHSASKTGAYRQLCEATCANVIELLRQGCNARTAVATAVALLEDSPLTNAGVGSNLTLQEKVECDASIMDREGFGSVGAVSNVKNPIMVCLSLLEAQARGTLSMGRIVPCMLVGEGAKLWARDNNIQEVDDNYLKTDSVIKSHNHYKQRLDRLNKALVDELIDTNHASGGAASASATPVTETTASTNTKLFDRAAITKLDESHPLDTVGAIVLDRSGHIASAVSSGGILLKQPGRVGHASMFGCGCWVEENIQFVEDDGLQNHSIAICTTGCGEYILKTLLARECAAYMCRHRDKIDYNLNEFFKKKFFNAPILKNCPDKLVGIMIGKLNKCMDENQEETKSLEFMVAHTTPSMCYGYMSSNGMKKPKSYMSRMEENKPEDTLLISSFNFNLNNRAFSSMQTSASAATVASAATGQRVDEHLVHTHSNPKRSKSSSDNQR